MNCLYKFYAFFLTLCLCMPVMPAFATDVPAAVFTLVSEQTTVKPGDEIVITLSGKNLFDVYGYQATISYPTDLLAPVSCSNKLSGGGTPAYRDRESKVYFAYVRSSLDLRLTGDYDLCVIKMKAIANGTAAVKLDQVRVIHIDNVVEDIAGNTLSLQVNSATIATPPPTVPPVVSSTDPGVPNSGGNTGVPITDDSVAASGVLVQVEGKTVLDADGNATVKLTKTELEQALEKAVSDESGTKQVRILLKEVIAASGYRLTIPAILLTSKAKDREFILDTSFGLVTIPNTMLNHTVVNEADEATIAIRMVDTSLLITTARLIFGSRPVLDVDLLMNGVSTTWHNPVAPIHVQVGYLPATEELWAPEQICVQRFISPRQFQTVTSGRFDQDLEQVVFDSTKTGRFGVLYAKTIVFQDLESYPWAMQAVRLLAAKGITTGVSAKIFGPGKQITRADFLHLLIRTLALEGTVESNFSDIPFGSYYADSIGIAKSLGITSGVGNNQFHPNAYISRQDMMVMVNKAMQIAGKLSVRPTTPALAAYIDAGDVADYANESVSALINEGIITGFNQKINPRAKVTRAEIAVVLYKLYVRP